MIEGTGGGGYVDTYYYLLQELYTVTGLIKKNGTLAEAYTYDTYGKVTPWGYRNGDFDRDGDVDTNDVTTFGSVGTDGVPTTDPNADFDMDGDKDADDYTLLNSFRTSGGVPPLTLFTSGVGNPYFFTGRRLFFLEDVSLASRNPNEQIQHNRARHYDPDYGRWLQRDPAGYVDGMGLYEYVRSSSILFADYSGTRYSVPNAMPGPKRQCLHVNPWNINWTQAHLSQGLNYFDKSVPELSASIVASGQIPMTVYDPPQCCHSVGVVQIARETYDYNNIGNWVLDSGWGGAWYPHSGPLPPKKTSWVSFNDNPGWPPWRGYSSINNHSFRHEFQTCAVCVNDKGQIACVLSCMSWAYEYRKVENPPPYHTIMLTISTSTLSSVPAAMPSLFLSKGQIRPHMPSKHMSSALYWY